ncbi:MAG: glycosyltransferase family 9 protein [Gammaproteobacteria bacterium]|nr:MAG: glycosyltransferase family 9 protein [Gammaproteobacteria bacterium]TLZ42978.1 MAG: glycosyltransferase family 9 protein [Gammaproteobacteria bacterium]
MIMLTALLSLLHKRYRLPCQVIGTGSWTSAIYQGNPDVAGVWSFHRHLPFPLDRPWSSVRRALRDSAPGPIYVCERHYRQLPRIRRMLRLSGVDGRRCVFIGSDTAAQPRIDGLVNLGAVTPPALRATDYPLPAAAALDGPRLHVLAAERAERDAWLQAQGWYGRELILLQPGNHRSMGPRRARWRRLNTDDKWWPLERWAELLHRIHACRSEAVLVLCGSPEEVPMLEEIRVAARLASVVVASTGLRQLFALCESAHSMISVDTGPAHAAAALSLPLAVLYGGQSPRYYLPRSPCGSAVVGIGGPPLSTRVDQLSVDAVFEAWRSLGAAGCISSADP